MKRKNFAKIAVGLLALIIPALFSPVARAGPQLVCWPFDIGDAKSLPWGGSGWHDAAADYDLHRLAADTLALLAPDAPLLVHMETLRRAAIYAPKNPQAAQELFSRLQDRANAAKSDALALFDLGYFAATYRQASMAEHSSTQLGTTLNGYEIVQRALAQRGSDTQMEFAAALVASAAGRNDAANQHLAKAAANAPEGSLLAKNLVTHCRLFNVHANTVAELRSQLVAAKSN